MLLRLKRHWHLLTPLGLAWWMQGSDSFAQSFQLGPREILSPPPVPIQKFCPDGHIGMLKDGETFHTFWPGSTSYRTTGTTPLSTSHPEMVLAPGGPNEFDNGGAWLFSVFRKSNAGLIGFYHGEDHRFAGQPGSKQIAWKTIALCRSADDGKTWRKGGAILTSEREKPHLPAWGGVGDFCVVWDFDRRCWVCIFQEHTLTIAISEDPEGRPGTWRKFYQGEFSQPGLGGKSSPLPDLRKYPGGNPSVHFNTFLQRWIMVWHTWEKSSPDPASIVISTSTDLLHWTPPKVVVQAEGSQKLWYPTILGTNDITAGQEAILCYGEFPDRTKSERLLIQRRIQFERDDGKER